MIDLSQLNLKGFEFGPPLEAMHITTITLVGYGYPPDSDFPRPRGNCFSVMTKHGEFKILNFSHENITEAERRGVAWPIQILPVSERHAVLHDVRIPADWYDKRWCSTCTPVQLLPAPQRLPQLLDIERGARWENGHSTSFDPRIPRVTLPDCNVPVKRKEESEV